jgi:hypothetical protein
MKRTTLAIAGLIWAAGCATGAGGAATGVDPLTSEDATDADAGNHASLPARPADPKDASVADVREASALPVADAGSDADASPPPPPSGSCGEATCTPILTKDIGSHFTGAGCTGTESYYTPYNGYDGIRRSWDGAGLAGTMLRTETNRSFKDASGACADAWPSGNTLSEFVRIYR